MIDSQTIFGGALAGMAMLAGFWALGKFGPGLLTNKLHEGFEAVKNSGWVRDPAHPKRAKALVSLVELLEDEVPEPGEGKELYDAIGAGIAGYCRVGSAAQWSKVSQQFGDSINLELDEEIKEMGAPPQA